MTFVSGFGFHLLRYQGLAVKRYSFTLEALQMKTITTRKILVIKEVVYSSSLKA